MIRRRNLYPVLLLALLALGSAPSGQTLRERLEKALLGSRPSREVSALALNLQTGEIIYDHEADTPLIPASNAKIWTTAAALDLLGPEYEFTTTFSGKGRLNAGAWLGDVMIIGGGDPTFCGRFHEGDATAPLRRWADQIRAGGIREIRGDLLVDDTFFDREFKHPAWPGDDPSKWYLAEVAGLALNENCVDLTFKPDGGGVRVILEPAADCLEIQNRCVLTSDRGQHVINVSRREGTNRFEVWGKVWKGSTGWEGSFAIHDPPLYFGEVLGRVLGEAGVRVTGGIRRAEAADREGNWMKFVVESSRIRESIEVANRRSQNFHAEQIFKTLGREGGEGGSFEGGSRVVSAFLARIGAPAGSCTISDGSGLSRDNRISARALARVLQHAARGKHGDLFRSSLAASGDSEGTLRRRMASSEMKGKVQAKTGSLRGISCLSGYVTTRHDETVVFSILMNGARSTAAARQAQDAFCTVLTEYVSD